MDFLTINYLESGNKKQQAAYKTLQTNAVPDRLKAYEPILVGTIPIEIDIDSSDLDIICYWKDKTEFIEKLKSEFSKEKGFSLQQQTAHGNGSIVCSFFIEDFEIEIFGQNIPTKEQNAYRHMITEYRILQEKGETFRKEIIELKEQGLKTEPAFAKLLEIDDDPYLGLLKYYEFETLKL